MDLKGFYGNICVDNVIVVICFVGFCNWNFVKKALLYMFFEAGLIRLFLKWKHCVNLRRHGSKFNIFLISLRTVQLPSFFQKGSLCFKLSKRNVLLCKIFHKICEVTFKCFNN